MKAVQCRVGVTLLMSKTSFVEDSMGVPFFLIETNGVSFFPKTPNKEYKLWSIAFIFNSL